MIQTDNSYKSY